MKTVGSFALAALVCLLIVSDTAEARGRVRNFFSRIRNNRQCQPQRMSQMCTPATPSHAGPKPEAPRASGHEETIELGGEDEEGVVLMFGGGDAEASNANTYFDCTVKTQMEEGEEKAEEDLVMSIPKFGGYADKIPAIALEAAGQYLNISTGMSFGKKDANKPLELKIHQYPQTKMGEPSLRAFQEKTYSIERGKEFALTFEGKTPLRLVTLNCKPADPKIAANKRNIQELKGTLSRSKDYLSQIEVEGEKVGKPLYYSLIRFLRNFGRLEAGPVKAELQARLDELVDDILKSNQATQIVGKEYLQAFKAHDYELVEAYDQLKGVDEMVAKVKNGGPKSKQDFTLPESYLKNAEGRISKIQSEERKAWVERRIEGYRTELDEIRSGIDFEKLPEYEIITLK